MQSGGYLPSLAMVSSHLCTVDEMCMHEILNISNIKYNREKYDTCGAIVYFKLSYPGIPVPNTHECLCNADFLPQSICTDYQIRKTRG